MKCPEFVEPSLEEIRPDESRYAHGTTMTGAQKLWATERADCFHRLWIHIVAILDIE